MKGFSLLPDSDSQVNVRELVPQDLIELQELCRLHAEFEKATWESDDHRLSRWQTGFFEDFRIRAWVAEGPNGICGYTTVTLEYSTWSGRLFAHMDCLFVSPDFRGMGIGRRLMAEVIKFAKSNGERRIEWQTPEWNEAALRFYESLGASWTRKRRFLLTIESMNK